MNGSLNWHQFCLQRVFADSHRIIHCKRHLLIKCSVQKASSLLRIRSRQKILATSTKLKELKNGSLLCAFDIPLPPYGHDEPKRTHSSSCIKGIHLTSLHDEPTFLRTLSAIPWLLEGNLQTISFVCKLGMRERGERKTIKVTKYRGALDSGITSLWSSLRGNFRHGAISLARVRVNAETKGSKDL